MPYEHRNAKTRLNCFLFHKHQETNKATPHRRPGILSATLTCALGLWCRRKEHVLILWHKGLVNRNYDVTTGNSWSGFRERPWRVVLKRNQKSIRKCFLTPKEILAPAKNWCLFCETRWCSPEGCPSWRHQNYRRVAPSTTSWKFCGNSPDFETGNSSLHSHNYIQGKISCLNQHRILFMTCIYEFLSLNLLLWFYWVWCFVHTKKGSKLSRRNAKLREREEIAKKKQSILRMDMHLTKWSTQSKNRWLLDEQEKVKIDSKVHAEEKYVQSAELEMVKAPCRRIDGHCITLNCLQSIVTAKQNDKAFAQWNAFSPYFSFRPCTSSGARPQYLLMPQSWV